MPSLDSQLIEDEQVQSAPTSDRVDDVESEVA